MIKKQIEVWKEMKLTREEAEKIQEEFDEDKKNSITYDALIKKYGLEGEKAFQAYLLGMNVASQKILDRAEQTTTLMGDVLNNIMGGRE